MYHCDLSKCVFARLFSFHFKLPPESLTWHRFSTSGGLSLPDYVDVTGWRTTTGAEHPRKKKTHAPCGKLHLHIRRGCQPRGKLMGASGTAAALVSAAVCERNHFYSALQTGPTPTAFSVMSSARRDSFPEQLPETKPLNYSYCFCWTSCAEAIQGENTLVSG